MPDQNVTTTRAASRLAGLLAGIVAPTALLAALAYYFGWRREEAFAGYFGIDPELLQLSSDEYVLRSVDALFGPVVVLLLVSFVALGLHVLLADRIESVYAAPVVGALGLAALGIGLALAIGHPASSRAIYVQALGLGVGAVLIVYALAHWRRSEPASGALTAMTFVAVGVAVLSMFWATAEYADSRGLEQARKLARDIGVSPSAVVHSKVDLGIDTKGTGSGAAGECEAIDATQSRKSIYRYRYAGFTLLAHRAGKYFVTPTPKGVDAPWDPSNSAVFILPDDGAIRIELLRGSGYRDESVESTFAGAARPAFAC
jgi:hypothetical protein